MRWIDAVREWNSKHNKGAWCMPRKGSPEHAAVMKLMRGEAPAKEGMKKGKEMVAHLAKKQEEKAVGEMKKKVSKRKVAEFLSAVLERRRAKKSAEPPKSKMSVKEAKETVGFFLYRRFDSVADLKRLSAELTLRDTSAYVMVSPKTFTEQMFGGKVGEEMGSFEQVFEALGNYEYKYEGKYGRPSTLLLTEDGLHFNLYAPEGKNMSPLVASNIIEDMGRRLTP